MENDIWGSEKIYLIESLEKRILKDADKVSFKEIKNLELPHILHSALENQAKIIFKTEKPVRIYQSERFNLDSMEIRREVGALRDAFIGSVQFTRDEIEKAVHFSVNLGFDALTRPSKTCLDSLFQQSLERTKSEIIAILSGIGSFSPFLDTLIEYVESQQQQNISKSHFQQLLREVRASLYKENPLPVFTGELKQLMQFYAEIGDGMEDNLAAEIVHGMLIERELHSIAKKFQAKIESKNFWTIEETVDFLTLALSGEEANFALDTEPEFVPPIQNEKILENQTRSIFEESEDEFVDDEEQFEEPELILDEEDELDESLPEINFETPQQSAANISFDDDFELDDLPMAPDAKFEKSYPQLTSIIDLKSKQIFIDSFFEGNLTEYERFVDNLEEQTSWLDAKRIMDTKFREKGISSFQKQAVKFSDLLFSRYFSRGNF